MSIDQRVEGMTAGTRIITVRLGYYTVCKTDSSLASNTGLEHLSLHNSSLRNTYVDMMFCFFDYKTNI